MAVLSLGTAKNINALRRCRGAGAANNLCTWASYKHVTMLAPCSYAS